MPQGNLDGRGGRDHLAPASFDSFPSALTMRSSHLPVLALAAVAAASCVNPRTEAGVAQALSDAANEINGLKNDVAQLQVQIDSLHEMLMKQDSTIARIAAVNNIPISR
jgi:hypothetical protein